MLVDALGTMAVKLAYFGSMTPTLVGHKIPYPCCGVFHMAFADLMSTNW